MSDTSLAVVLLNFGDPERTFAAVRSLQAAQGEKPARILLVDNGSGARHSSRIREFATQRSGVDVLLLKKNLGFAGGMNRGVDACIVAGSGSIVLMNSDITVTDFWLTHLLADWDRKSIRNPVMMDRTTGTPSWSGGRMQSNTLRLLVNHATDPRIGVTRTRIASGAVLLVSVDVWTKLNGLDERFFMYWEDVDFSHRAGLNGVPLEVCHRSRVDHEGGGTTGEGGWSSPDMYFYAARNRWLYLAIHEKSNLVVVGQVLLVLVRLIGLAAKCRSDELPAAPYCKKYISGSACGIIWFLRERRKGWAWR